MRWRGLMSAACVRSMVDGAAAPPKVLLLAASPTQVWRATRYELVRAAAGEAAGSGRRCGVERAWDGNLPSTVAASDVAGRARVGAPVVVRSGSGARTFAIGDDRFALRERPYEHVSDRLWDAALVLALYLRANADATSGARSVVELGAGLGLPSIDLARRGRARVTATDGRAQCVAHLRANADAAGAARLETAVLDFDAPPPDALAGADLVIGSDVCYLDDQVAPLAALLAAARPRLALIAAPTTRSAVYDLAATLIDVGAAVTEERFALLSADADDAAPNDVHAAHFRVLAVRWPHDADATP